MQSKLHACAHVSDLIQEKPPLVAAVSRNYVPQAEAPRHHPAAVGGDWAKRKIWPLGQFQNLETSYLGGPIPQ